MTRFILRSPLLPALLTGMLLLPAVQVGFQSAISQLPLPQPRQASPTRYQTYTVPGEFSLQVPPGWFIERSSNPGLEPREGVILMSQPPTPGGGGDFPQQLIKTDVAIYSGSFETIVRRTRGDAQSNQSRIDRRGKTRVGGRDAFREWGVTEGTHYMITLIRFTNTETLYLISFYDQKNSAAVPIIQRIHGSVRVLRSSN